jgi:hypothetical protein
VKAAQLTQRSLEIRFMLAPQREVTQIDKQVHGNIVFAWLLRLNQHFNLLPRGLLTSGQPVEMLSSGFSSFALFARKLRSLAFSRHTFPLGR